MFSSCRTFDLRNSLIKVQTKRTFWKLLTCNHKRMSAGKQELPPPPGTSDIFSPREEQQTPAQAPSYSSRICFVVIWQIFFVAGEQDFPPPPGTSDIFPPGEEQHAPSSSSRTRKKSRSRSRSPEGRSRRRQHYDSGENNRNSASASAPVQVDDAWKKTTDAFLQNLGAPAGLSSPVWFHTYIHFF